MKVIVSSLPLQKLSTKTSRGLENTPSLPLPSASKVKVWNLKSLESEPDTTIEGNKSICEKVKNEEQHSMTRQYLFH